MKLVGEQREHGGDVGAAAHRYGHAEMIDLSTGISPKPYPAPDIVAEDWLALPTQQASDLCGAAARRFYGVPDDLGISIGPGTQALLQLVPQLFSASAGGEAVWIPAPTYNEHAPAWAEAGFNVVTGPALADDVRNAVMVVPNNPTGMIADAVLMATADKITARGGRLVLDGAFVSQQESARQFEMLAGYDGVVHLRSFGKFFGMAGLRLGFAVGSRTVTDVLNDRLGPWAINAAGLAIGTTALNDQQWAAEHQQWLDHSAQRLQSLFTGHGLTVLGGCSLFQTISDPQAHMLHAHLAKHRLWTRKYRDFPHLLRSGIPATDSEFEQLDQALVSWSR